MVSGGSILALDADNDIDGDGVCGDVDVCPLDVNDDSDGDGSVIVMMHVQVLMIM